MRTSPSASPSPIDEHTPLPADDPYLIAFGDDEQGHAVPRSEAIRVYATVAAADVEPRDRNWTVAGRCGAPGKLVTKWGPFVHGNPYLRTNRCAACGWLVAIDLLTIQQELDALAPSADVRPVFARLLADPAPAATICEAIVTAATADDDAFDLDHPVTVQLLAHVTAHEPRLLVPEACAEDECHHMPADAPDGWRCPLPDARVACAACSTLAGSWAGEWQGTFLDQCTVTAPCGVLLTVAQHYGVDITGSEVTHS
ncbi:hypothetical protein [Actinophytocola sp.]|uniref:hypothetical protein n=1 Tax=Actinophytocola sp. TaxID=1872138 RepID=UPI002ED57041